MYIEVLCLLCVLIAKISYNKIIIQIFIKRSTENYIMNYSSIAIVLILIFLIVII